MNFEHAQIDKVAYGQKAANIVRKRIIEGKYAQGERLTEVDLSKEFNISRGCIREAFQILRSEGLLNGERNKYTKVFKLNQKGIEDLFAFRMILELYSIEFCIKNNCIPFDQLDFYIKKMDKSLDIGKMDKFAEPDLNFHEAIIKSTDNIYIIDIYKSIKYKIMALLSTFFKEEYPVHRKRDHHKFREYLKNNDIARAQKYLTEHINYNLDFIIKISKKVNMI